MSEEYYDWSPYNYTGNSPIQRIDVNGEFWGLVVKVAKKAYKVGKKNLVKIKSGKSFNKTIKIGKQEVTYSAYKLPSGEINVGRITIPK